MMTIIVGFEHLRDAAAQHGDEEYGEGNFRIRVSLKPHEAKRKMGMDNAVVYPSDDTPQ